MPALQTVRFSLNSRHPPCISLRMSVRTLIWLALLAALAVWGYWSMIRMPGDSYEGPFQPLTAEEAALRDELERHVRVLAGDIGERNVFRKGTLDQSADYIESEFAAAGYTVERQGYEVREQTCYNLIADLRGRIRPDEIIVVGAHYDSVMGSPGANDNGTGIAGVLALARRLADQPADRTIRFIAFVNEEPPFFQTGRMGSVVYARMAKERGDTIVAMMSLETIGYYSDEPGSQRYPPLISLLYPSTGNFIGIIGNVRSRELVRSATRTFRETTDFPSEGAALPSAVPGVGWSDHWAFWRQGWPAIMFTDTAPFRYPHYHRATDRPEQIHYESFARVVMGIERVIVAMAQADD